MGRRKHLMMKIDNPSLRHLTYSKRREGILKKVVELSVLCEAEIGLLMFSPTGRLTGFASNGRIEDVFLRYVDQPDELRGGLRHLKFEGEIMEKIAKMEDLQEKLNQLNQRLEKAKEKMRFYNPDLDSITSLSEVDVYQEFLNDSLQHIEKLKAKLLGKQIMVQKSETVEVTAPSTENMELMTVEPSKKRNFTADDQDQPKTTPPPGPHLTLEFLKAQRPWNL
ncbi:hypothetical protein FNV43_RR13444 [Rhamnella rubrinervis]|uniref:MADS-box domain-containing protein n=1 Tax=Rhamnella rubrinervis TaxID=2594499 RepID=A0A8K0H155_9ROSA|nr:hypothetical protein FNV43_RR13444 [Rhamnella rubrinervis]